MKKIARSAAPKAFTDLVDGPVCPVNWESFRNNHHDIYLMIRNQLLDDQKMTSGYTEIPLDPNEDIHIDHFRKKGMFGVEELFNWENFVVDERENSRYGAGYKDSHVDSKEIYNDLINPVIDDPESYLSYMEDGTIIPKRDLSDSAMIQKAVTTINIFNLNHQLLRDKRGALIQAIKPLKGGGLNKDDACECMRHVGFFSIIDFVYSEKN